MNNVETGDEDVRKNLGAIPSAKAVNPHQQQQQQYVIVIYWSLLIQNAAEKSLINLT